MSDEELSVLARLDERTKTMAEDVSTLKHVLLEGNGVPAITVQVATLDARMNSIEQARQDSKVPRHVAISIVISIFLGVAAILVDVLK